jgi:hypothetical protein
MSRYIFTFQALKQGVPVKHARGMRALPFLSRKIDGEAGSTTLHFLNDVPERTRRKHVEKPIQRLSPRFRHANRHAKGTAARDLGPLNGEWASVASIGAAHVQVLARYLFDWWGLGSYVTAMSGAGPRWSLTTKASAFLVSHTLTTPILTNNPITKLTQPSQWLLSTVCLPSTPAFEQPPPLGVAHKPIAQSLFERALMCCEGLLSM